MSTERDNQFELAPVHISDMVVLLASGAHTVTGDAVDTLGMRSVTFIMEYDVLAAADDVKFGVVDSEDNGVADAYAAVSRDHILPASRRGDSNPLEVMPGIYVQTFGVTSAKRYVKPTLTATAAVVANVTLEVWATMIPQNTPMQGNLEVINKYPGDGRP